MNLQIACPSCHGHSQVAPSNTSQFVACPHCQTTIDLSAFLSQSNTGYLNQQYEKPAKAAVIGSELTETSSTFWLWLVGIACALTLFLAVTIALLVLMLAPRRTDDIARKGQERWAGPKDLSDRPTVILDDERGWNAKINPPAEIIRDDESVLGFHNQQKSIQFNWVPGSKYAYELNFTSSSSNDSAKLVGYVNLHTRSPYGSTTPVDYQTFFAVNQGGFFETRRSESNIKLIEELDGQFEISAAGKVILADSDKHIPFALNSIPGLISFSVPPPDANRNWKESTEIFLRINNDLKAPSWQTYSSASSSMDDEENYTVIKLKIVDEYIIAHQIGDSTTITHRRNATYDDHDNKNSVRLSASGFIEFDGKAGVITRRGISGSLTFGQGRKSQTNQFNLRLTRRSSHFDLDALAESMRKKRELENSVATNETTQSERTPDRANRLGGRGFRGQGISGDSSRTPSGRGGFGGRIAPPNQNRTGQTDNTPTEEEIAAATVESLLNDLKSEDDKQVRRAIRILSVKEPDQQNNEIGNQLIELWSQLDSSYPETSNLSEALKKWLTDDHAELILEKLDSISSFAKRRETIAILGTIKSSKSMDALVNLMLTSSRDSSAAMSALRNGGADAEQAVLKALEENPERRILMRLIVVLTDVGGEETIEFLKNKVTEVEGEPEERIYEMILRRIESRNR